MRFLILSLVILSSQVLAQELISTDLTSKKKLSIKDKKYGVSLRRELNIQNSINTKINSNLGETNTRSEENTNNYEANTLSIFYMDHIYRDVFFDVALTYTVIGLEENSAEGVEMARLEANIHERFYPKYSLFAGINLNQFTGPTSALRDYDNKPGYQIGLQRDLNEYLKLDLRYWITQNIFRSNDDIAQTDIEQTWTSTSLGLIYVF